MQWTSHPGWREQGGLELGALVAMKGGGLGAGRPQRKAAEGPVRERTVEEPRGWERGREVLGAGGRTEGRPGEGAWAPDGMGSADTGG